MVYSYLSRYWRTLGAAWAGLITTAEDLSKLYQSLLLALSATKELRRPSDAPAGGSSSSGGGDSSGGAGGRSSATVNSVLASNSGAITILRPETVRNMITAHTHGSTATVGSLPYPIRMQGAAVSCGFVLTSFHTVVPYITYTALHKYIFDIHMRTRKQHPSC